MDTMLPAQYAFYLCNDCADKYGEPAGLAKTPDEVFWAKVEEAMIERYGHCLNETEVLAALDEKHGVITKLEREGRRRT